MYPIDAGESDFSTIVVQSDAQIGKSQKFTKPAFAPEALIVITGGLQLAKL
jgi:hypothetical protein